MKNLYITSKNKELCILFDNQDENEQLFKYDQEAIDELKLIMTLDFVRIVVNDASKIIKTIKQYNDTENLILELQFKLIDIKPKLITLNLDQQKEIFEKYGIHYDNDNDNTPLDLKAQIVSILDDIL